MRAEREHFREDRSAWRMEGGVRLDSAIEAPQIALERSRVLHDMRHAGWHDIEVGGPGLGPFPVFQFNGTTYVAR